MNHNDPQIKLCERCRRRRVEGKYLCNPCSNVIIQETIDEFEAEGILKKPGEFRPDCNGKMQPVYTLTELGRAMKDERIR